MDLGLYFAFVAATTVLMLIPGPNVALIVANSMAHGTRAGLTTVAGTSVAMIPQLALTVLGMSAALGTLATWFEALRWLGVAYLVYLGVQQWRAPATDLLATKPEHKSPRAIFMRGFLVSLTNPKTLLFYGAFFPQFMHAGQGANTQLALLATTFLALAVLLDGTWAVAAGRARPLLASRGAARNRISGALLIGAALGLALARKK
jgi:threonine/homoserine/homoserine lactone efflux protein